MALKEPWMIKTVLGNTALELEADPGQSLLVKDIFVYNPATNYLTVSIEKTKVGYFRVGGNLGSHLPFPFAPAKHSLGFDLTPGTITTVEYNQIKDMGANAIDQMFACETVMGAAAVVPRMTEPQKLFQAPSTILKLLTDAALFTGYPVAEGEKMTFSGVLQADAIQCLVYEIHDAGDFAPESPNGSKSKEYVFLQYGDTGASITAAAESLYDNVITPAEFPNFPFGAVVPAKTNIDILGILASNVMVVDAATANYIYTTYLKLIRERETLFDEDKNGILHYGLVARDVANLTTIGEGQGFFGNFSDVDAAMPLVFPTPLSFGPGDELNIYLTTAIGGTGGTLAVAEQMMSLIMKVARIEE